MSSLSRSAKAGSEDTMLVVKTRAPTSRARFLLMAAFLLGDAVWLPAAHGGGCELHPAA
jgi:hypothetical protein